MFDLYRHPPEDPIVNLMGEFHALGYGLLRREQPHLYPAVLNEVSSHASPLQFIELLCCQVQPDCTPAPADAKLKCLPFGRSELGSAFPRNINELVRVLKSELSRE